MKKYVALFGILCLPLFWGCGTQKTVYVPVQVETVKTEIRDNFLRDSVYVLDSVFVNAGADSVTVVKYKYVYRDRTVRDSIFRTDTLRIPFPVEVEVERPLSLWETLRMRLGECLTAAILIAGIFLLLRKKSG